MTSLLKTNWNEGTLQLQLIKLNRKSTYKRDLISMIESLYRRERKILENVDKRFSTFMLVQLDEMDENRRIIKCGTKDEVCEALANEIIEYDIKIDDLHKFYEIYQCGKVRYEANVEVKFDRIKV